MLISIIGTRASGKSAIEQYLVSTHRFQRVRIGSERQKLNHHNRSDGHERKESHIVGLNPLSRLCLPNEDHDKLEENPLPTRTSPYHDSDHSLCFQTAFILLDYVTQNWRDSFVTCDLDTPHLLEQFIKRPFFLLIAVDAPLVTRHLRLLSQVVPNLSLEAFVEEHDMLLYRHHKSDSEVPGPLCSTLHDMFRLADVHIINNFTTIFELHIYLDRVNLPDPDRLRPRWDTYFMTLAALAARRSNCMKRRVGAILVRDKRIVSTGYNGTPRNLRNCNDGGCRRCNSGVPSGQALDECLCLHAEENALLEAGRERVGMGAVLYCDTCPCLGCAIKIVQAGVKEVVYNLSYKVDDRTAAILNEAGITLRQHSPPM